MARGESPAVLRDVQTLFSLGTIHGLSDAQLLERFRSGTDPGSSELAFAGLVARHGSMVMGVCRRALHDPHDVADAFQATFLILVRKAETVEARDSLGRWLYGVSRRVAVRARRTATRRSAREVDGVESLIDPAPPTQERDDDLPVLLDEEIGRLPEKYRTTVILCDLEGLSQEEAARRLGCAVGTVKSRLSRGREKLRSRLIRRGVAPSAAIVAWCGDSVATEVPATLAEATVQAAIRFAAGRAGTAGAISASVYQLTQGVLMAMFITKMQVLFATVITVAALASGAGVMARQATAPQPQGEQAAGQEVPKTQNAKDRPETVKGAPPVIDTPSGPDDEELDRIDAVQLDIELLASELEAMRKSLSSHANTMRQTHAVPEFAFRGDGGKVRIGEEQKENVRKLFIQAQNDFSKLRETYLEKSKELRRKQRELQKLWNGQQPGSNATPLIMPPSSVTNRILTLPAAKGAPALEQRVTEIERKLDEIMGLLKELKR